MWESDAMRAIFSIHEYGGRQNAPDVDLDVFPRVGEGVFLNDDQWNVKFLVDEVVHFPQGGPLGSLPYVWVELKRR
jgi:hypothetical protein